MFRRMLAITIAAACLCFLPGCGDKVNQESFDTIQNGMDLTQVEDIMGGAGDLQEAGGVGIDSTGLLSSKTGEGATKDYLWGDENTGILVKFKDGKVSYKQKMGF
ncbi:MAG: hypothetical protein IPJ41_05325 [Phycisphaerales bacterium]|nr:hypothetical protein [Phycisphaerales bacterium]